MHELLRHGAVRLGGLVNRGEVRAREVVEAHLQRAAELNGDLNAITDLQADRALDLAAKVDEEYPFDEFEGYLPGVPVTVKSSIATKGFKFECGSRMRLGQIADRDAAVVSSIKEEGAIVIGTTNVPEFLMAYETDNAIYGRTNSPIDPSRTPGGSSGGCAAAVAAGMASASFGSDAGGSVRVPAHFCGLYGFKPTPGFIPRSGHWPAVAGPTMLLAGVGPIAKTAVDLEFLVRIGCEADTSGDALSIPIPRAGYRPEDLSREVRVGWFDHAWDTPATAETRAAVRTAAQALSDLGFKVDRIELEGLDAAPGLWWMMFGVCLSTLIANTVPEDYRLHPLAFDAMATVEEEREISYDDLLAGWVSRDILRSHLASQMESHPLLLCPVSAIPAFRHGEREWTVDGQTVRYPKVFSYSQVFNLFGLPAATVPVTKTADGLPIGVQIVGPPHRDLLVMDAVRHLADGLDQP
ncbi:MAG: amidase [Bryobacterales bacterium]|nr:amidase [Bryobacterales bacterium]